MSNRFRELAALVELASSSGFSTFRYRAGDLSLELSTALDQPPAASTGPPPAPAAPPAQAPSARSEVHAAAPAAETAGHAVVSPITGTFYASASPGVPPFVNVGDVVAKGRTLCIVEAMKLMNEIKADRDGRVAKILPKNEELVTQGAPLFLLEA